MKKETRGIIIKVIVIAFIFVIVSYGGFTFYKQKKEQKVVLEMCSNVTKTVPSGITKEKYYPDEQYVKGIDCISLCSLRKNVQDDCYEWSDGFRFTFNMEDSFDQLSASEQYEIINRLGLSAFITYNNERDEQYPDYLEYQKKYNHNDKLFGIFLMTVGGDEQVIFKTTDNTYEYAEHVHDYFIKNGEEVYLHDENGHWTGSEYHHCYYDGCTERAYNKIIGIFGTEEWYCDEHYKQLKDAVDYIQNN